MTEDGTECITEANLPRKPKKVQWNVETLAAMEGGAPAGWRPVRSVDEVRANRAVRVIADEGALMLRMQRKALGAQNAAGYAGGHAGKEGEIIEKTDGGNARLILKGGGGTCCFPWDALLVGPDQQPEDDAPLKKRQIEDSDSEDDAPLRKQLLVQARKRKIEDSESEDDAPLKKR